MNNGANSGSCASAAPKAKQAGRLVRRFFEEVLTQGHPWAAVELVAPEAVICLPTGRFVGPEAARRASIEIGSVYADLRIEAHTLIAEGDRVIAEWTLCGTERRELLGVPPSGRWTCLSGQSLTRIAAGQIVEHHMFDV